MADVMIVAIAIASAVSPLIVADRSLWLSSTTPLLCWFW
jgi:hypothetical protein